MTVEKQVLVIYAGTSGYLDDVPVEETVRFEQALVRFLDLNHRDLQREMEQGRATARTLVEAHLSRIAALDPRLRSILQVNPDAGAIADALVCDGLASRMG